MPGITNKANATVLTAGAWTWTDCNKDDLEPALSLEGSEAVVGDRVDAAYLRQLSLDLMKLASLVAAHQQQQP